MVETLLHEMIHAYLFVTQVPIFFHAQLYTSLDTQNNRDRDGHGPEFHKHMYRINAATGASISVYHTFHDEVAVYKQHWWRCNGPCMKRPPFYGFVKRAMNRAPGPNDRWWAQHLATCGGTFVKVKEPEKQVKSKEVAGKGKKGEDGIKKGQRDIRDLIKGKEKRVDGRGKPKGLEDANMVKNNKIGTGVVANIGGLNNTIRRPSVIGGGTTRAGGGPGAQGGGGKGNIFGFGGTSFGGPGGGKGGLKTGGKVGTVVVKPGWKSPTDNSFGGSVVNTGGELAAGGTDVPGKVGSSGAGFKLGSSSSSSSQSSSSVQEMLRRKWGSTGGSLISTSASAGHVTGSTQNVFKAGTSQSQVEMHQCPVCSKFFPAEEINPHLDLLCLVTKGNDDNIDPVFDEDGSDADLIAAAQIIEEDARRINTSKVSIHSISDSDDDEPLVKRACDDKQKEKARKEETAENLFGDTTLQDDLDLLAALEDVNEGGQEGDVSMFACPVCDILLNHAVMNEHLDGCIT